MNYNSNVQIPEEHLERMGAIRLDKPNEPTSLAPIVDQAVEGPQPLIREVPNGETYPVEALGPLKQVVDAVHDRTQAPIAIAAQSALAVVSLAVQGFADVETLGGFAPSSLYCLTVEVAPKRSFASAMSKGSKADL